MLHTVRSHVRGLACDGHAQHPDRPPRFRLPTWQQQIRGGKVLRSGQFQPSTEARVAVSALAGNNAECLGLCGGQVASSQVRRKCDKRNGRV